LGLGEGRGGAVADLGPGVGQRREEEEEEEVLYFTTFLREHDKEEE